MSNDIIVCRTCLSFGNKIHDLRNTQLQETFEKLTSIRLKSTTAICYICYAQLQKCRRFADMSLKSEVLLTELIKKGVEITQDTVTRFRGKSTYSITPIDYFYNGTRDSSETLVKEDPITEYNIVVKEEKLEIEESDIQILAIGQEEQAVVKTEPTFVENNIVVKEELEEICLGEGIVKEELDEIWLDEDIDIEEEVILYDSCVVAKTDLMHHEDEYVSIEDININDKENLTNINASFTNDKLSTSKLKTKKRLKTHIKKQVYICDVCDATFNLRRRIVNHMNTHSRDPYTCMLCYKTFLQERYLKEHVKVHTREKPYICHRCGKLFTDRSSLNRHMKTHSTKNSGIKTHNCEICSRKFLQRPHLTSHLVTHSGLKPYTCDVCNHSFTQKGSLKGHMRIHTGEKTHYCKECNKGFYRKGHLLQHLSVHSGERLFPCDMCARRFTSKRSLVQHTCKREMPH